LGAESKEDMIALIFPMYSKLCSCWKTTRLTTHFISWKLLPASQPACSHASGLLTSHSFAFFLSFFSFEIDPSSIQSQQRKANKEKDAKIKDRRSKKTSNIHNTIHRMIGEKTEIKRRGIRFVHPPIHTAHPSIHPSITKPQRMNQTQTPQVSSPLLVLYPKVEGDRAKKKRTKVKIERIVESEEKHSLKVAVDRNS
jgi:hypothetical protein